jgi:hypothetical protein
MAKIQKPGPWAAGFGILCLAIAIACGYFAVVALARRYGGATVQAKIASCDVDHGLHGGHGAICKGTWTVTEAGHAQTVAGYIEGAEFSDEGKQIEVVVVGDRGFAKRTASGLGYTAAFFALLFLANAVMLLLGLYK